MSRPLKLVCTASLVMALAACGAEPPQEPGPVLPGPSGLVEADVQDVGEDASEGQGLSYVPRPLASCRGDQVVEIRWNLAAVGDARSVDILLVDRAGNERTFARSALTGSKPTGPWAEPGQVFVARDPETRQEMARLILEGSDC